MLIIYRREWMTYIRKKQTKSGKIYAYEITAIWDADKKQSRSISKYIGTVDTDGNITPKGTKLKQSQSIKLSKERLIADFGNSFLVSNSIKQSLIFKPLEGFFIKYPELLALMTYRICQAGAMYNFPLWLEGNAIKAYEPSTKISSQDISRLLSALGEEALQRKFFKEYLADHTNGQNNVIIDATSLPSNSSSAFNSWGYNDGGIDTQFRFHLVVDQNTKKPLFYRMTPGNIADVSTLGTTMAELRALGVASSFALLDAGFCSEDNIKLLREHKIDFLTRLPASRIPYKEAIAEYGSDLEQLSNACIYGKRSLFVKTIEKDLYGKITYFYIILDPLKKAKNIERIISERGKVLHDEATESQYQAEFLKAGMFILISSKAIPASEVLAVYYTRQTIEQIFGFAKDDLSLLPIRCHSDRTIAGYLFLQFLLLVIFIEIREKLAGEFTVEQAMLITRNLKCKIFDKELVIQELTKNQKKIFALANIIVPTSIPGI